jgi:hypothetical protein
VISLDQLLNDYGRRAVDLIKSRVPVVSGKTRDSVYYEVIKEEDKISLRVKGRPFFPGVETGRKPTQGSTYSGFDERLDEWMADKGFPTKLSKTGKKYYLIGDKWMTGKSLAYLINQRGDKKHRTGKVDVYSSALESLVQELIKEIPKNFNVDVKNN